MPPRLDVVEVGGSDQCCHKRAVSCEPRPPVRRNLVLHHDDTGNLESQTDGNSQRPWFLGPTNDERAGATRRPSRWRLRQVSGELTRPQADL